jgi:peptidoglycan hydrolase-like protein with peptidoglycan-binding domain
LDRISHEGDLRGRLVRVEELVANIEQRMQRQEQSTTTQGNLSRSQWKKIQSSLTAQGFNPGSIDGRPCPNTVNAIREYQKQRSDHPDVTGTLTDIQVDDLLK